MKKVSVLLLAVIVLGALALAGCGEAEEPTTTMAPATTTTTMAPTTTTTQAPTTTTAAPAAAAPLNWDVAIDHEGETATVTGPVFSVVDKGAGIDKVLVFVGKSEDEAFIAMVPYASLDVFGGVDGLKALIGKNVNVTGTIAVNAFELKGEIECTEKSQIVEAPAAAGAALNWDVAIDHEGETATVTGPVFSVVDKGAGIDKVLVFVGKSEDEAFIAMVPYASLDAFGGVDGLKALVGKTVDVTGTIAVNAFELKGEIECTEKSQIAVK